LLPPFRTSRSTSTAPLLSAPGRSFLNPTGRLQKSPALLTTTTSLLIANDHPSCPGRPPLATELQSYLVDSRLWRHQSKSTGLRHHAACRLHHQPSILHHPFQFSPILNNHLGQPSTWSRTGLCSLTFPHPFSIFPSRRHPSLRLLRPILRPDRMPGCLSFPSTHALVGSSVVYPAYTLLLVLGYRDL
jgi:hypothetical protein